MALWMIRGGRDAEYELKALRRSKVYFGAAEGVRRDLTHIHDKEQLTWLLGLAYPDMGTMALAQTRSQIQLFVHAIHIADWVVMPSQYAATLHFGSVKSAYIFADRKGAEYLHTRDVHWFRRDVPRDSLEPSMARLLANRRSVFKVEKDDADTRFKRFVAYNPDLGVAHARHDGNHETGA